jgi:outer membrane immunogenic protein
MRKELLAATIAVLGLTGGAFARSPAPVPVMSPIFSWEGWYAGIHGGYGWGDSSSSGVVDPSTVPLAPGWVVTAPVPGPFAIPDADPSGGVFGAQLGYNHQLGRTVLGLEADISWSGIKGTGSAPFNLAINNPDDGLFAGQASTETILEWFGTVRGRLGYAHDRFLPYITGGLAYGEIKSTLTVGGTTFDTGGGTPVFVASSSASASTSAVHIGFAVGGGVDWAVNDRWMLRAEYLYLNFADKGISLSVPGGTATNSGTAVNLVRGALNYRF